MEPKYIVREKDLDQNLQVILEKAKGKIIWGVVKGDGYGLGLAYLAQKLNSCGITHFAVTSLPEARGVRDAGLTENPVLMLRGATDPQEAEELLRLDVICSVGSREDAEVLEAAAERLGVTARAHVEIDTGMGRYGFLPAELPWILPLYRGEYAHIRVTGTYTHFHTAGHPKVTAHQFERFQQVLRFLQFMECDPGMIHCCNSLAFWKYPQYHMDAVRLGSVFLGRVSYAEEAGLSRVGWVEAPIQEVRGVQAGSNVGYGSACTVQEDTTLAVVGVGYYHGFAVERGYDVYRPQDCLRNMARYLKYMLTGRKLKVYIADTLCPVLGHVGMLNLVADVTGLECRPGDPVYIPVNPLDRKGMEIEYRPADQEGKPSSRFRP